jgi:glucose-6-phosphate isomerase
MSDDSSLGVRPVDSALRAHAERLESLRLADLLADDPDRAQDFALRVGPLYASFARQGYDREALEALFGLARDADVESRVRDLFDGEPVNLTEGRAALHTALRSDVSQARVAREAHAVAREARQRMRELVESLERSDITDVVSIGIGGSDLGPRLAVDALAGPGVGIGSDPALGTGRLRVHFLSNVDGHAAQRVLAGLDPAHTAGVLISKTFGTQETLLNGRILHDWLGDASRLYAVSANVGRPAEAFGIPPERILPMWDWVGGRYSLWSAVGFPIALAIGMDAFEDFLAGAAEMDAHVHEAPVEWNLAAWHALTAVWNRNALGHATQAVLPYDDRLKLLSNYLQQLVMESLGKSVRRDGSPVEVDTVPVWWGGVGTDTQHSFFQALHQGTSIVPADFIGVVRADNPFVDNHRALHANLLAQTEAFANGQASDDPHRAYAGGRPSTMILLDALTPHALGVLLALYEHSVYLQSVIWGINAFDQFGVELGKQVAGRLLPALTGEAEAEDPVTQRLLAEIRSRSL